MTYPDGFPTHTKVQKFYLDGQEFFLKRLDYVTDVAAGVVAHYCYDHKEIDELVFPTFRRVVWKDENGDAVLQGRTSFLLDYTKVTVNDKN